jgi:hypothetical protein
VEQRTGPSVRVEHGRRDVDLATEIETNTAFGLDPVVREHGVVTIKYYLRFTVRLEGRWLSPEYAL